MGMFDNVTLKIQCPKCKETITNFQTKDADRMLETVSKNSINNFYSSCDKCNLWVEFTNNKWDDTHIKQFEKKNYKWKEDDLK